MNTQTTTMYDQQVYIVNSCHPLWSDNLADSATLITSTSVCRPTGIRTSTAFLKLKHPELAPILGHVLQRTPFTGEHGVQYHCEMAVALFQKVPKEREKQDPYMGTYKEGLLPS